MLSYLLAHPVLALLSLLAALVAYGLFKQYSAWAKMPPGPFPLPLLGNLLDFRGDRKPLTEMCEDYAKKYGQIFSLWFGPMKCVILNDLDSATKYTVDNPHDFASRPDTVMGKVFMKDSQDVVFGMYNKQWQMNKKIGSRCVRKVTDSNRLEDKVITVANDVVDALKEVGPITPVRLAKYIQNVVYNVIAGFCFGTSYKLDDPIFLELVRINDEQAKLVNDFSFVEMVPHAVKLYPLLKHLPITKLLDKQVEYWENVIQGHFDEHLNTFDERKAEDRVGNDILDSLIIEMRETEEGRQYVDRQMAVMICFDVFNAGVETTQLTLQWLFLELAINDDIQEEVAKQIRDVIGDRPISLKDRPELPLLEAALLETLRMHPIVPLNVPHAPVGEKRMNGYMVPENTMIMTNIQAIQRNPLEFKEPDRFNPHRFIEERKVVKSKHLIPFGMGRRVCMGEQLAKNDMFLIAGCLLQQLRVTRVPGDNYTTKSDPTNDLQGIPADDFRYYLQARA